MHYTWLVLLYHLCAVGAKKAHGRVAVAPDISIVMASHSPAFYHFHEPIGVGNGIFKGKCKHCDQEVSMKGKSTSNLITHLKVLVTT
jgi:hypothetical protein